MDTYSPLPTSKPGTTGNLLARAGWANAYAGVPRAAVSGSFKPEHGGALIWLSLPEEAGAGILRERVKPEGVFFETGGFAFSDASNNDNHVRLACSMIGKSLIADGIARIVNGLPEAFSR